MPLLELGEGAHYTDGTGSSELKDFLAQHKPSHNVAIVGKGSGATEIHGKVRLDGWYPNLRNLSFYPGTDTDWAMVDIRNPGTFRFEDIWVHPGAGTAGLVIRTTDAGKVPEVLHWPPRNAPLGGARISVSMLRDFYAYGMGKGLQIYDDTTQPWANGQFTNHVRIDGGHIVTDDISMLLSGLPHCLISGFHIDVTWAGKGLRFDDKTTITWVAPGFVEPRSTCDGMFINGPMENFKVVGDWPMGVTT